MTTLRELLDSGSGAQLRVLAGQVDERVVASIRIVESAQDLRSSMTDAVLLLPPRSSATATEASGHYRLDVLLRQGAAYGVAGVLIARDQAEGIAPTARAVAERFGLGLLGYPPDADVTELLLALTREIVGDEARMLQRLAEVSDDAQVLLGAGEDPATILEQFNRRLGLRLVRSSRTDRIQLELQGARSSNDPGTRLAVRLATQALHEAETLAQQPEVGSARPRAAVVAELLLSTAPTEEILRRARTLGIPIDGTQVVAVIEVEDMDRVADNNPVREFELLESIGAMALRTVRQDGATWTSASVDSTIVLARSDPEGSEVARTSLHHTLQRTLERLTERFRPLGFRFGVGLPHEGADGLRRSAAEARAAAAAAGARGRTDIVEFADAAGLRRMLIELSSSDGARGLIADLLAPLDDLGPEKAERAIRTLGAYLATDRSLAQTAKQLDVHRNSVVYRIARIVETLDVDLDDPDTRLALELACRIRGL